MNNFRRVIFLAFGVLFFGALTQINPQAPKSNLADKQLNQKDLVLKLRDLYFKRDFEAGYDLGKDTAPKYPNNVELQAWFILNMARNELAKTAVPAARQLTEKYKNNGWAWFALANAYARNNQSKDAFAAAEQALVLEPKNEEFIFTKGSVLYGLREYGEAVHFLEANSSFIKNKSRLRYTTAEAFYRISERTPGKVDVERKEQSFENFKAAVVLDPNSVNANFVYGLYLNTDKRFDEAIPFLKKASSVSPNVTSIRRELWKSIEGQANKTDDQKKIELTAEFDLYLTANQNSPAGMAAVSQAYGTRKDIEKRDFYENQVLEKYPNTKYAESIDYERIDRLQNESNKNFDVNKMMDLLAKISDPKNPDRAAAMKESADRAKANEEGNNKIRKMRQDFTKRTTHFDEKKLGDVYWVLLRTSVSDKNLTDDGLSELIEGALKYQKDNSVNVNSQIADMLFTYRTFHPNSRFKDEIEKYARAGIDEAETKISALPATSSPETAISLRGTAKNLLGSILTRIDKLDEAERELLAVQGMISAGASENPDIRPLKSTNNLNLALLYQAKKDYDKAEAYFLENAQGRPTDTIFFRNLYTKRNGGNLDGFEAYLKTINGKIDLKLRERVVASRIKDPKDAVPFSLATIDGRTVSFDDLKGKVVVINFWGTWCGPCVAEMPELQRLYKKYENDNEVAIITMDANDELEDVRKFIADKKYEFPVLLGDKYTGNIIFDGAVGFPTTLFINKQGKIEFIKIANSPRLYDEFGWRIEALKTKD